MSKAKSYDINKTTEMKLLKDYLQEQHQAFLKNALTCDENGNYFGSGISTASALVISRVMNEIEEIIRYAKENE